MGVNGLCLRGLSSGLLRSKPVQKRGSVNWYGLTGQERRDAGTPARLFPLSSKIARLPEIVKEVSP